MFYLIWSSTSWHKQQFCRGSYTAIGVGGSQDDIENIAQPLYASPHHTQPAVLFAGEHTHSNFYSTVHGAYLSGRTAAQVILTPDTAQEIVMESDTSDLSSWIQGIALDWKMPSFIKWLKTNQTIHKNRHQ